MQQNDSLSQVLHFLSPEFSTQVSLSFVNISVTVALNSCYCVAGEADQECHTTALLSQEIFDTLENLLSRESKRPTAFLEAAEPKQFYEKKTSQKREEDKRECFCQPTNLVLEKCVFI